MQRFCLILQTGAGNKRRGTRLDCVRLTKATFVLKEPEGGAGVQPGGRAQEEVPGDHQPQRQGGGAGGQAQGQLRPLGPDTPAGHRDPGGAREHAVLAPQAAPQAVCPPGPVQSRAAGRAPGQRLPPFPWRRRRRHRAHPGQGCRPQSAQQAQHPGSVCEERPPRAPQEAQPLGQEDHGQGGEASGRIPVCWRVLVVGRVGRYSTESRESPQSFGLTT